MNTNLLTGLAAYLETNTIGSWDTATAYGATDTAIVLGTMPQSPDRIIALSAYGVSDEPCSNHSIIGVQIRCRWGGADPRYADDLADSIFTLLHGATHLTLGAGATAVTIVICERNSFLPLGQDGNNRYANSSNYYCTVYYPSTNRL
jgi:hypothetical protein